MDDKKEGIISTAQDAVVGTAKAGWEGAKDLAETATNAVTDAVSGVQRQGIHSQTKWLAGMSGLLCWPPSRLGSRRRPAELKRPG